MSRLVRLAMRVSSSSSWRIAPNSRPISASVSSVLVYSRASSKSRAFSMATATCAPNCRSSASSVSVNCPGGVAQQVEGANDAALPSQRHDELGERTGHRFDVARVFAHVVDEDRLAFLNRGAHETVPDLDPQRAGHLLGVTDRVRDGELFAFRIQQVHGECLKLRDPRDQLRDLLQQLRQVEYSRDLPCPARTG